jgi:hypothetical protein
MTPEEASMTDQQVSTREQWTPSAPAPQEAEPNSTGAQRPAEDGAIDQSATGEPAADEPVVDDQIVDGSAVDEPGALQLTTEHAAGENPAGDGDGYDTVGASVPAGHTDPAPIDPEHAASVTSAPGAEPVGDPPVDDVDHGDVDSPDVAARDAVDVTDTGQPVDDVDERADVTGGEMPLAAAPGDDAPADVADSGELLPADVAQEPVHPLFDDETTKLFRDRWQHLQLRFIDDPHTAAGRAGTLLNEVVTALHDAVDRRRSALEDWQYGPDLDAHAGDTERLRLAVRRYRDFLDQLLGL